MSELHPLLEAIRVVRSRTLARRFLAGCAWYGTWGFAALLLPAALLPCFTVIVFFLIVILAAIVSSAARAWRGRPTPYAVAQSVDEHIGSKDRLSTALYFASEPGEIFACQRRDALASLEGVEPRAIVPVWKASLFQYPLVLAVTIGALIAYRPADKAPALRALERVRAELKESLRAVDLPVLTQKKQVIPPDAPVPTESLLSGLRTDLGGTISPNSGDFGLEQEFGSGPSGKNPGSEASDALGEDSASPQSSSARSGANKGAANSQAADKAAQNARPNGAGDSQQGGAAQESGEQQDSRQPQSLGQKLKDAFKGLMAALNGKSAPQPSQRDPSSQNDQSAGKAESKSGKESDAGQNSGGKPSGQPSDASAGAPGDQALAVRGTGAQGGPPPATKGVPGEEPFGDSSPAPSQVQATPEVVPLQAVPFKGEANVRAELEGGKAMLPYRTAMSAGNATTEGAGHGTLPLRYRVYVQRYFDHSGKSKQSDSTTKGN